MVIEIKDRKKANLADSLFLLLFLCQAKEFLLIDSVKKVFKKPINPPVKKAHNNKNL